MPATSPAKPRRRILRRLVLSILMFLGALAVSACTVSFVRTSQPVADHAASPQSAEGRFRNPLPRPPMGFANGAKLWWDFMFNKPRGTTPPLPTPVLPMTRAALDAAPDRSLYRLGHSTLLIKLRGGFWITDPVFAERASPVSFAGPKRWHAPPIALEDLPPLRGVVLSHDHYDHLDRETVVALAQRWRRVSRPTRTRLFIGAAVGLVAALFTAIPLLLVVIPAAIVGLPLLLGKQDTREQQLILALEAWARSLASTAETGKYTLREVIGITRGATPPLLRSAVDRLHARMSTSWSAAEAFKAFADELDSAYVDEVTIYLIQAAQFNSGGLARALSGVADTLAVQAKQRMEIFNEREKPRRTMQIMTGIVGIVLAGLVVFSQTPTIAFYRTPIGQIALLVIIGIFVLILIWAKSQTRVRPEPRIVLSPTAAEIER